MVLRKRHHVIFAMMLATESCFLFASSSPILPSKKASKEIRHAAKFTSHDRNSSENQLYELGRRRPILASEWISSDFGRNPEGIKSLHSALDPLSSAAHRRGAFLDNMLQMIGESPEELSPEPVPRTVVLPTTLPTLEGERVIFPGKDSSYLVAVY